VDENFRFDVQAKRIRHTDGDLLQALESASEILGVGYFTTPQYDKLHGKRPHSSTIIERFGSWKKALSLIGIEGGRDRCHSADELMENLEAIWRELGYPPGKRQIGQYGKHISEKPYKRVWGSVRKACDALAAFQNGNMSRIKLLAGDVDHSRRKEVSLKNRWAVLKRDNYCCVKCGASPSSDHSVDLEVDHVIAISRGGSSEIENLQTLCRKCNQGKKDR
jgi:5-methylcytosine-specific restriction endonuclease McrA